MAGLVPAIPMIEAPGLLIGIAGTSPAMTFSGGPISLRYAWVALSTCCTRSAPILLRNSS
jgi:hypothetical protein